MRNIIGWVEIPVLDMTRAKTFYKKVFKQELTDAKVPGMDYWMFPWEDNAPDCGAALVKGKGYVPSANGTIAYFNCDDLTVELGLAEKAGGTVLMPKTPMGEGLFIALVLDSEGNRIGLYSPK
jgi:uncharacterized protein